MIVVVIVYWKKELCNVRWFMYVSDLEIVCVCVHGNN
jgi:hypothetical protein